MSYRRLLLPAILIIGIGGNSLFSQKLSVETLLDTNIIKLGDQIGLKYNIEKKRNVRIKLPIISDTLVKGVEVIGKPVIDSSRVNDDLWQISLAMKITSFDTGIYYLPPQPIIYSDEGYTDTLLSRAAYLMVQGVPIDSTKTIRDIKGPVAVPVTLLEILLYVIPVLVLGVLVYIIVLYYKKRKKNEPLFKPLRPEEPAHITALRELDRIKAQKLWQQKQVKEYYTRITYIIRWYIEKRFIIKALEMTSDQILDHIRNENIDNINYTNLESLLNLADLVKFAKEEPDPEANMVHLDNAYDFVKKSKMEIHDTQSQTTVE